MFDTIIGDLLKNHTLIAAVTAWISAQLIKFLSCLVLEHKLDFTRLTGPGGMPSGHAAMVSAMAVSVGRQAGWASTDFGVAVALALVVMYDAAGVRQAVGKQARVLNALVNQLPRRSVSIPAGLREILGHTPVEVCAGAVLGLFLAIVI